MAAFHITFVLCPRKCVFRLLVFQYSSPCTLHPCQIFHIRNFDSCCALCNLSTEHPYSPDLKNVEGVTPLELATSPDLKKALRAHLDLKSPEKISLSQNAAAPRESACTMVEATKVDETLEMFADQESVEQEVVQPSGDIEQMDTEGDLVEDQSVEAVTEVEKPQGIGPTEDSVDEVEEISVHIVADMEAEVKVESDEETNALKAESKIDNMEQPPVVAAVVSPDANKENLGSSSLESDSQEKGEEDKEKSPNMMLGGLRKPKNPFTEIRRSTSSSRAAMLVSVCVWLKVSILIQFHHQVSLATGRRPSLDVVSSPSPPLLSPKVSSSWRQDGLSALCNCAQISCRFCLY